MNYYELTDAAIAEALGARIKALRLRRNLSQQAVADATTLSLNVIKSLEAGKGKLSSVIAVLRKLRALDDLDHFIPEVTISPIELAKRKGSVRKRAASQKNKPGAGDGKIRPFASIG